MSQHQTPPQNQFSTTDVNDAAVCIAAGGRLLGTIEPDEQQGQFRLTFVIGDCDPQFIVRVTEDPEIQVSAQKLLATVRRLIAMVASSRRMRDRSGR